MEQQVVPTSPKSTYRHKGGFSPHPTFLLILLSLFFGTLAGAFGFLMVSAVLSSDEAKFAVDQLFLTRRGQVKSIVDRFPEVIEEVVPVYASSPTLATEAEWKGNAVVLTADGWMVMPTSIFPSSKEAVVILPDGSTETIERSILDAWNGLTFFHVAASNLSVVHFTSDSPRAGQLFSLLEKEIGGFIVSERRVSGEQHRSLAIRSTTQPEEVWILDTASDAHAVGSPVFDQKGSFSGIVVEGGKLVPSLWIAGVLESVIMEGVATRSSLDISYINLGRLTAEEKEKRSFPENGILITKGERELLEGDIITIINATGVTLATDFSSFLHFYPVGTTLYLSVLRGNEEVLVELKT